MPVCPLWRCFSSISPAEEGSRAGQGEKPRPFRYLSRCPVRVYLPKEGTSGSYTLNSLIFLLIAFTTINQPRCLPVFQLDILSKIDYIESSPLLSFKRLGRKQCTLAKKCDTLFPLNTVPNWADEIRKRYSAPVFESCFQDPNSCSQTCKIQ